MNVLVVTEKELRQCVGLDRELIRAIEEAFSALARGEASVPPVLSLLIPEHQGEVDVKTAYIRGWEQFAIKIASGFFENYRLGLPTGSGMMVVFSARTGMPEAVLLDNAYLTDVRTGAAGAVAADHLARSQVRTVGMIGSGTQARYQLLALRQVRDFQRVLVYSRNPERVQRYIQEVGPRLGVEVVAAPSAEAVVRESEIVVTTTPSHTPYLRPEWLHAGLHITAMGSDTEEKQELYPEVLARADLLVCDSRAQCARLGELHHALQAGILGPDAEVVELGEITSGRRPGRTDDEQITVCDLTGVGVQDTAIAVLAVRRAAEQGLGVTIAL
ncbi:MAG: cyclodeaminase [Chloroflexia bacterium]